MKRVNIKKLKWHDRFTYVKNVVFTAEDLGQKGTLFQIVKFKPGKSIDHHYHKKTSEIFFVESGQGKIWINHRPYVLKPGEIILCQPGDWHAFKNTGRKDLIILIFKTNEVLDKDIY